MTQADDDGVEGMNVILPSNEVVNNPLYEDDDEGMDYVYSGAGYYAKRPVQYGYFVGYERDRALYVAEPDSTLDSPLVDAVPVKPSDPKNVAEAVAVGNPERAAWLEALAAEWKMIVDSGTVGQKVRIPVGAKALPTSWVLVRKHLPDGSVERYKARLVVRGDQQRPGVDFFEVFAPVAQRGTLRLVMGLANHHDLDILQLDVTGAFLHSDLPEDLYIRQPQGFHDGDRAMGYKLYKSLYGLRQAPLLWYNKVKADLTGMGYEEQEDPGLFKHGVTGVMILVYVDDFLVVGSKQAAREALEAILGLYQCRDLGECTHYLGISVVRDRVRRRLKLHQESYARDLVARHGLAKCNPVSTPMEVNVDLKGDGVLCGKGSEYRAIVGGLLYLATCTRPDLSCAAGKLSRYMSAPTVAAFAAAKRVLRYIAGTLDLGICFGSGSPGAQGYCDSDWAGDFESRRILGS